MPLDTSDLPVSLCRDHVDGHSYLVHTTQKGAHEGAVLVRLDQLRFAKGLHPHELEDVDHVLGLPVAEGCHQVKGRGRRDVKDVKDVNDVKDV